MKSLKKLITVAALLAAVLPGVGAGTAQAVQVTFDFTSEGFPGNDNGITTLPGSALFPATFTGEFGRTIDIVTFLSGGSSQGYALDTFGSGPPPFGNTQLYGQRAFFYFGANGGPTVDYRFGSDVRLVSATFLLYSISQNLEISFRDDGSIARSKEQYFFDTDAYDDLGSNPPSVPPETTVLFDNTFPLVDQIFMRSFGVSGAALKTLVIDDPNLTPIPVPAAGLLLLTGLGSVAALARRR